MIVYIVTKNTSEDYHGTYVEIIAVFQTQESAINRVKELQEDNYNYNIVYDCEAYNVE
jgi:hypothetical protein